VALVVVIIMPLTHPSIDGKQITPKLSELGFIISPELVSWSFCWCSLGYACCCSHLEVGLPCAEEFHRGTPLFPLQPFPWYTHFGILARSIRYLCYYDYVNLVDHQTMLFMYSVKNRTMIFFVLQFGNKENFLKCRYLPCILCYSKTRNLVTVFGWPIL
jgi:hypothetical protein